MRTAALSSKDSGAAVDVDASVSSARAFVVPQALRRAPAANNPGAPLPPEHKERPCRGNRAEVTDAAPLGRTVGAGSASAEAEWLRNLAEQSL